MMRSRFLLATTTLVAACATAQAQVHMQEGAQAARPPISVKSQTASSPESISPAMNPKIEEMLVLTGVKHRIEELLNNGQKALQLYANDQVAMTGEPANDQKAEQQRLIDAYRAEMEHIASTQITWVNIEPSLLQYCAENFSQGQIDEIIAFYKSSAGKAVLEKAGGLDFRIGTAVGSLQDQVRPLSEQATKAYFDGIKKLHPLPSLLSSQAH
jgi:hypothetical protein